MTCKHKWHFARRHNVVMVNNYKSYYEFICEKCGLIKDLEAKYD